MEDYGALLFTEAVRAEQDKAGMGERYAQVYAKRHRGPLDDDTRSFLETRDTIFVASIGGNGWPYVQHRGGPAGFLKVLGPEQIGFADYVGNKQFITRGNLATCNRVSIIAMDFPRKARLKLLGEMRMIDAADDPELCARLHVDGAAAPERLAVIDITAMDWNCPKYITPRFSEEEVAALVAPHLRKRDDAIAALAARLRALGEDPSDLLEGL